MSAVTSAFSDWFEHELVHGGTSAQRVDFKIVELLAHYVPSSPRQLMELGMQCEALLDIDIDDPIFGHQAEDAYEALRIAVSRHVAQELEERLGVRKETLVLSHQVIRLPTVIDLAGGAGNGTSQKADEDGFAAAA